LFFIDVSFEESVEMLCCEHKLLARGVILVPTNSTIMVKANSFQKIFLFMFFFSLYPDISKSSVIYKYL
jgi:hypothetical protein